MRSMSWCVIYVGYERMWWVWDWRCVSNWRFFCCGMSGVIWVRCCGIRVMWFGLLSSVLSMWVSVLCWWSISLLYKWLNNVLNGLLLCLMKWLKGGVLRLLLWCCVVCGVLMWLVLLGLLLRLVILIVLVWCGVWWVILVWCYWSILVVIVYDVVWLLRWVMFMLGDCWWK